jgi:glycyl-tRNA synthetase
MDKIVALCKGRGFVYAGSEIYGGLANTWDYGPLGVELKTTSKRRGGRSSSRSRPITWAWTPPSDEPAGVGGLGTCSTFNDPLIDCKSCKMRTAPTSWWRMEQRQRC